MANPNPQHNPTDGLGTPCYVQVTGTNITNRASGGLTVATEATANDTTGLNGQGYGAVAAATKPNAQFALTLSLSGATIGGTVYAATCQLTPVLKDVGGTTYGSLVGSVTYRSEGDPANKAGAAPSWYKPSNFGSYDPNVASVSSSGLITARAVGQTRIEVMFPAFDEVSGLEAETGGDVPDPDSNVPEDMIYCGIIVTVVA